jgi:hypothetical protein
MCPKEEEDWDSSGKLVVCQNTSGSKLVLHVVGLNLHVSEAPEERLRDDGEGGLELLNIVFALLAGMLRLPCAGSSKKGKKGLGMWLGGTALT